MGGYFGDQSNNMRNNNNNERSGNSSAKKGKNKSGGSISNNNNNNNNNNSDKPKQPQRGLGVAQLEKIRLHTQMASCGIVPNPFFTSPFQEEMMRYQAGYQGIPPPPPPPYGYSSPSVPSSAYGYQHPNAFMMGMGDHMERATNMGYSESQPCNTASWNPNNFHASRESQPCIPQSGMVTRHLLSHVEQQSRWNEMFESKDSSSQNSETSETGELDLDLKL